MTAEEMSAVLAVWKARLEKAGLGFPTDGDLTELLVCGAELENARLRKALLTLFDKEAPGYVKLVAAPWVEKVNRIFDAREIR